MGLGLSRALICRKTTLSIKMSNSPVHRLFHQTLCLLFDHFLNPAFEHTPQERELRINYEILVGDIERASYRFALERGCEMQRVSLPALFVDGGVFAKLATTLIDSLFYLRNSGDLIRLMRYL